MASIHYAQSELSWLLLSEPRLCSSQAGVPTSNTRRIASREFRLRWLLARRA